VRVTKKDTHFMDLPLVSIVVVTYNQAVFMHETLKGTMEQDYQNLEVIVSDDGSEDGTTEIIMDYAKQHPGRLFPIVNQGHLGITGNSNRALKACRGKYIAFQGGDDIFLPQKISKQVRWMEEDEQRVLCGHDVEIFNSSTNEMIALWSHHHLMNEGRGASFFLTKGVPFAATSIMVRSRAIPASGFDERVPIASDWKMWIDVLADGGKFGYIDGIYARYRRSDQSISLNIFPMIQDRLVTTAIIESSYPWLSRFCFYSRARTYYDLGICYMKKQQQKNARELFYTSLKTKVTSVKVLFAFILTFLPLAWSRKFLKDRNTPRKFSDYLTLLYKNTP
jgi:glycosyltransferase involved in cell wall biosynthesis